MREITASGLNMIKGFEGLQLKAYQDSVGVWTIGYGCTEGVHEGMVVTGEQARNMILKELTQFEVGVSKFVTVPLNDNEFAALVSFSYNLGLGSLQHSTLLQKLNAGDRAGAAVEFLKWNHAGGQVLAGLTRRRLAEHDLFLAAVDNSNTPGNSNGLPPPPTDDEILDDLKSHE